MPILKPSVRAFSEVREEILKAEGPTSTQEWVNEEIERHEAISKRALRLFRRVRKNQRATESSWFIDPDSESSEVEGLFNAYMLSKKGKGKDPEIILWAGFTSKKHQETGRLLLAGTFNVPVMHETGHEEVTGRSKGLSTYDGSPINSYGTRILFPFPALPSDSSEFSDFEETLDFIDEQAVRIGGVSQIGSTDPTRDHISAAGDPSTPGGSLWSWG